MSASTRILAAITLAVIALTFTAGLAQQARSHGIRFDAPCKTLSPDPPNRFHPC